MALLSISHLGLSFGNHRVLDDVNLTLEHDEHVGLVGRNGCGKSTLLKLIAGLPGARADEGQVQVARQASVGYLHQQPELDPHLTLRQEAGRAFERLYGLRAELEQVSEQMAGADGEQLQRLMNRYERLEHEMQAAGGYAVEHRIEQTLHGLGLEDRYFNVPVSGLSGGQKARLALAKLLLSEPDLLLLDEPTNHLDIAGRQWLESFLAAYNKAVILVSHDRWLLNRVVNAIYELEAGQLVHYPGSYDRYRELRAERRLAQQRQHEKQRQAVQREQAFIDRYRAGQRARQAKGREKRLERYKEQSLIDPVAEDTHMNIQLAPAKRSGDIVVEAQNLAMRYDTLTLFDKLNVRIERGERIGIIGPNGAGKTTLVRCLLNEQQPTAGQVKVGAQVDVGHYRQTHEHLNLEQTVVQYLQRFVENHHEQSARALAGAFLFTDTDQDKPLSTLSGGERSRAVLASLMAGGHNVLILDEPTNHLDIPSSERLEQALLQFTATRSNAPGNRLPEGTLILISHDRMLLERVTDRLIAFEEDGRVVQFPGRYSEYIAQAAGTPVATQPTEPRQTAQSKPQPAAQLTNKRGGAHKHLNQKKLEQRIEQIESRLAEIDTQLVDPMTYKDASASHALQEERNALADELAPLEAEWLARAGDA